MNSKVIARNSLWFGLETGIGLVSGVVTSIVIARALGPVKLGHFTYIGWLVMITSTIGSLGVPTATRKYMAEYLGRGEAAVAKAIFFTTIRFQAAVASLLTVIAMGAAWFGTDPDIRWTAVVLAAAMWPGMLVSIPSQANMAAENLGANVPGSLVSNAVYVAGVILTLSFSRDTLGLAITMLAMRTAELVVRIVPVMRWMNSLPDGVVPPQARRRIFAFSRQSMVLLILSIIVWDRSEVIVLRYFSDIRQLAFYTVVFNATDRLRLLPDSFSIAAASTMHAQYGRDPAGLQSILATTVRYLLLMAIPIQVGVALLSGPVIALTYGDKYLEVIPALTVAALLGLPRVVLSPVNGLLAATERQSISVRLNLWMAVLNLALDAALIPKYGTTGAVVANGVSQSLAAIVLSRLASTSLGLTWPAADFAKMVIVSGAMSAAVLALPTSASPLQNLVLGFLTGAVVFILAVRSMRVLGDRDGRRLQAASAGFPAVMRAGIGALLQLLIPRWAEVRA